MVGDRTRICAWSPSPVGGGAERSRREPRGRALPLCGTGGVRSCFSEPRFPYLRNGDASTPRARGRREDVKRAGGEERLQEEPRRCEAAFVGPAALNRLPVYEPVTVWASSQARGVPLACLGPGVWTSVPFPRRLSRPGCPNRTPQTGWLTKNRDFFPMVWGRRVQGERIGQI